ncbi:hypothetical protein CHH28_17415 [Bacterioplanes sanyensis]|uniref:Uncharacterized protein n=1 Tax=Bacterioplanes sanyensis TaxID=1249553 RepID=A0A222FMU0_9GAMM|nr:hypothetical protein [Bacterioplanes sanyensis]ASP40345.1 hypothetical protein CHH28_17415 [Bacterioplanes sanyensis]
MNNQIMAQVYGAETVTVEGTRYSKLWIGQPVTDPNAQNAKGIAFMAVKCDATVYDALNLPSYPANVTLDIELRKGSKNSLTQYCTGVRVNGSAPSPKAKAG